MVNGQGKRGERWGEKAEGEVSAHKEEVGVSGGV
jgi:hypothetical protein